jgi:hypothetical protein
MWGGEDENVRVSAVLSNNTPYGILIFPSEFKEPNVWMALWRGALEIRQRGGSRTYLEDGEFVGCVDHE